jgi:HEAT repeat protein
MATVPNLLTALSRAYALSETRSEGDPQLLEALNGFCGAHQEAGWLVVRLGEEEFLADEEAVPAADGELASLHRAFQQASVTEIRFQEVPAPGDLEGFLGALRLAGSQAGVTGAEGFRGFEEIFGLSFTPSAVPIRGMAGSILDLFGSEGASAANTDSADEKPPVEGPEVVPGGWETPAAGVSQEEGEEETSVRSETPGDLEVAARRYLVAPREERVDLRDTILEGADVLTTARATGKVAQLVEILADPESGATTSAPLELAQEILTPAVASYLVAQMGEARDEDVRNRMVEVCSGLGREMALALADALGQARDRFQRRAFMEGMLAQGPMALEVAQGMVEDPRWFVVRNGVTIIGEMGSEESVSLITGSLANSDSRVRKEAVHSLAKLGGKDAEQLLLGMLDDQDAGVKAMACRAVGVLGVEKSFKPLMKILDEDQDQDVQVECLQALGKLGDPGAVPLIEKRAVKGLFSRPSQEIRVAAYRALAGIGTPHARELLEKAAKDTDPGVRTVVQALLG